MCEQHKFVFEFDKAYNHQLIEKFEASPAHPLSEEVAPAKIGVYALYWKDRLVYPKNGSYVVASASRPGLPRTLPPRN